MIIPNSVEFVGGALFQGCSNLTEVYLSDKITDITGYMFSKCTSLTTYTISENIKNVYSHAFEFCTNLKEIRIGKNVTEIFWSAFENCSKLTTIYCYPEVVPKTDETAFKGAAGYAVLYVPKNSIPLYKAEKPWKDFLLIKEIPHYTLSYLVDGNDYKSFELIEGEKIIPEAEPTKEGYTFSGWSEIPETMPAYDVIVTGTFSINHYTLTYMIGDEVYKQVVYEYGATITPEPQPEGDYITFEWVDLPETMPAHDVVVYANFESGIVDIMALVAQGHTHIYTVDGKPLGRLQKGLNIVVMQNGTVRKVYVK